MQRRTHRRYTLSTGAHHPHGQSKTKPRSTSTAKQIRQKTICSSLAQPCLVRNKTGGWWRWTPAGGPHGNGGKCTPRGCACEHPQWCGDTPVGLQPWGTHAIVGTSLRDCSYRWPTPYEDVKKQLHENELEAKSSREKTNEANGGRGNE